MSAFNKAILVGNLTKDPELKYIPSGQAVVNFTIAVNRKYSGKDGEKKEEVAFIRIIAWAKLAEICNEYLKKGSSVLIEGRIQTRSWDGPDGSKRYATEVLAETVQFLGGKPNASGGQEQAAAPAKTSEFGPLAPDEEIPF